MAIEITKLDEAWERVNALGGTAHSEADRIAGQTIDRVLRIIEELGGEDPAPKRFRARRAA